VSVAVLRLQNVVTHTVSWTMEFACSFFGCENFLSSGIIVLIILSLQYYSAYSVTLLATFLFFLLWKFPVFRNNRSHYIIFAILLGLRCNTTDYSNWLWLKTSNCTPICKWLVENMYKTKYVRWNLRLWKVFIFLGKFGCENCHCVILDKCC
jgi:hypothetical protein